MMHSLRNYVETLPGGSSERLNASLPQEIYNSYAKQRNNTVNHFKVSVENSPAIAGISTIQKKEISSLKSIPIPCQKDYSSLIFDERYCGYLYNNRENNPALGESKDNHPYLTMKDGGTIPCVMMSVLHYFKVSPECEKDLLTIAEHMVANGYRKNGIGVLHSWFDWFVPNYYGLNVLRPMSVSRMIDELRRARAFRDFELGTGTVVVALVKSNILGIDSATSSAIVIWGIYNGMYLCTSSQSTEFFYKTPKEINKNINACWVISKEK